MKFIDNTNIVLNHFEGQEKEILKLMGEHVRSEALKIVTTELNQDSKGQLANSAYVKQYGEKVRVGFGTEYAAAHEFGVTVEITAKQRKFFWAMFKKTKDEKWRNLALSKKYTLKPVKFLRRPLYGTDWLKVLKIGSQ